MNYADLRDKTVAPLLKAYGQPVTLRKVTTGTYDPITGLASTGVTVSYPGNVLVEDYSVRDIDGTVIQQGDKKVLLSLTNTTVTPTTADNLSIGGVTYSIQNVNSLEPGGVSVLYTIQARR